MGWWRDENHLALYVCDRIADQDNECAQVEYLGGSTFEMRDTDDGVIYQVTVTKTGEVREPGWPDINSV